MMEMKPVAPPFSGLQAAFLMYEPSDHTVAVVSGEAAAWPVPCAHPPSHKPAVSTDASVVVPVHKVEPSTSYM